MGEAAFFESAAGSRACAIKRDPTDFFRMKINV